MNISTSRGFALPTAVMALVILAVLITGAIYMAQQEYRVGWSAEQSSVAFNMTERSAVEFLTNWNGAAYNALPLWGSTEVTGTLPEGTWSATVTKMTPLFYYVDMTGVVSLGGPLRAGATHRVGLMAHMSSADLDPPAALTTRGSISVRGNAAVLGQDVYPPEWTGCTNVPANMPGIATDMTSTVGTQGQGMIDGTPPVTQDPSITDETFTEFGSVDWNDLIAMADVFPPAGNLDIAPRLLGGACNAADVENWGEPEDPGTPCESYFPIIFVNGDANIQANGRGQGILLVAGDLSLRGQFAFYGVIIVQGEFETQGNGNRIFGGVLAGNATLGGQVYTGGSIISYSKCALERAILGSNLTRARRLPNRSWVDVSYLTY